MQTFYLHIVYFYENVSGYFVRKRGMTNAEFIKNILSVKNKCELKCRIFIENQKIIRIKKFIIEHNIMIIVAVIIFLSSCAFLIVQNDRKNVEITTVQSETHAIVEEVDDTLSIKNDLIQLRLREAEFNAALSELRTLEF